MPFELIDPLGDDFDMEDVPGPGRTRTGYAAAAQHAMSNRRPKHVHAHQHSLAGHPHSPLAADPAMQIDPSLEALAAHTSTSVSTHTLPPAGDAALTRKTQNRLAQREFRQRKQEYIRALECRVELLSSDPGTQIDRLRWLLRQLMLENAKLRVMLGVVAAHVAADGMGGFLGAHTHVRRELEQFVFNPDEQRSLKVWNPHSDDNNGHNILLALRAQSQLPPEASLAPVETERRRPLPTLPDLRKPPPKRPRKRSTAGSRRVDSTGERDGSGSPTPSPTSSNQQEAVSPTAGGSAPMQCGSNSSAAPVVAAAAAAARAAPASVVQGLPAWGPNAQWGQMIGWPPQGVMGAAAPSGPAAALGFGLNGLNGLPPMNSSVFAARYRASMSLGQSEQREAGGSSLATAAVPLPDTDGQEHESGQGYVAMPSSPPTWWGEPADGQSPSAPPIFDSRA